MLDEVFRFTGGIETFEGFRDFTNACKYLQSYVNEDDNNLRQSRRTLIPLLAGIRNTRDWPEGAVKGNGGPDDGIVKMAGFSGDARRVATPSGGNGLRS
jgi:hypothetical protein